MADLPSILGGMAQGFLDFGKSAVDLFGTGGASIADLIESARTGKVTTKNSDDFRKWLYNTDDVKDAAAKGLGTALNGVQTVSDYIPGIGAVTRNPLFNAGQGALGGIADEFKTYGKDYDLGRAGQRAAVSAGGALASTGLADALKGSGNALLKSGTAQGLARGAVGGAIGAGGYTAIDGGSLGDVANSALQGAGMGAALGGTMGALQDFRPAKTYDVALTDEEKAARIANAKNMLANEQDPQRIAELNAQITRLQNGADANLSVDQEDYFKNSTIRDADGNLMPVYHSSPNKFTEFDDARLGNNTAYDNTAFGHFVTNDRDFSSRFRDIDNNGGDGYTMELYADVKNPITHPYQASGKYQGADLDNIVKRYYEATDNPEALAAVKDWADESGQSLYEAYMDMTVDENPFDAAATERDLLRNKGYDAVEFVEGLKNGLVDGSTDKTPISSYAVFNGNQLKGINNLAPTDDINIMKSAILPDDAGLATTLAGQDLSVNSAKVAPNQLGLFGQPMSTEQIEGALALDGEYSPKDNKVTKAMRARAEEIMGDYKTSKKVPENELYNKIDESTLPGKRKSTGAILDDLYSKGVKSDDVSNNVLDQLIEKEIGGKMDKNSLAAYLFGDMDDTTRKDFIKKNLYTTKDYDVDDLTESILKNWARRKAIASGTMNKYNIDNLALTAGNKTIRQGYTGALDSALSERLGIAPGNTYKQNGEFDTPGALGRYIGSESRPDFNNYMVKEVPDIEEALNTAGHERLHSFQAESRLENRYSKEVADAYNELASDLKKASAYKSDAEIKNRYKKGAEYWGDADEQEARMLQQYLGARGFTDYNKRDARTYGGLEFDNDKIVPAFDKFFDKLRDMSKRGIALPALTALFGGGALMASQQKDKEEVK